MLQWPNCTLYSLILISSENIHINLVNIYRESTNSKDSLGIDTVIIMTMNSASISGQGEWVRLDELTELWQIFISIGRLSLIMSCSRYSRQLHTRQSLIRSWYLTMTHLYLVRCRNAIKKNDNNTLRTGWNRHCKRRRNSTQHRLGLELYLSVHTTLWCCDMTPGICTVVAYPVVRFK